MTDSAQPAGAPAELCAAKPAVAAAALGLADVRACAARLAGRVVRTPALNLPWLDDQLGARIWLKLESLQHIGAFKARGALNAVDRLAPEVRARGVVTYSSGNHAQALALAASLHKIPATIAMPEDAPAIKVAGVRRLGAEIVFAGRTSDDRRAAAHERAAALGAALVEPFDHPDIVVGQGTATLELLETMQAHGVIPDALLVPTGGGGVLAGACLACARMTACQIYSVEPHGCDSMAQSLRAGRRIAVPPGPTLADGLKPTTVGALNFAIAQRRGVRPCWVDDAALARALVRLLVRAKLLTEPSGAAGLAALLDGALIAELRARLGGRRPVIGVIVTGGNVDPALVGRLLVEAGAEA